jgi:hypothetical protein
MDNLAESIPRDIGDQFVNEFKDNISKNILKEQKQLVKLLVEDKNVLKKRIELTNVLITLRNSRKELRCIF